MSMHPWLDSVLAWSASTRREVLLEVGSEPLMREGSGWQRIPETTPLPEELLEKTLISSLGADDRELLEANGCVRAEQYHSEHGVFRVSVYRHGLGIGCLVRPEPMDLEILELQVPDQVRGQTLHHNGIILFCGPQRSGKTVMAKSFCSQFCRNQVRIAYVAGSSREAEFDPGMSLLQRFEIQDGSAPWRLGDLAYFGDLRDVGAASALLRACEAGAMAVGVLEVPSTVGAVERFLGFFDSAQRQGIRGQLSSGLRGVFAVHSFPDAEGVWRSAWEILLNTSQVATLVRSGEIGKIPSLMRHGNTDGMQLMDDSLEQMVQHGKIDRKMAAERAQERSRFE